MGEIAFSRNGAEQLPYIGNKTTPQSKVSYLIQKLPQNGSWIICKTIKFIERKGKYLRSRTKQSVFRLDTKNKIY